MDSKKRYGINLQLFLAMLLSFFGLYGLIQWLSDPVYGFSDVLSGDPEGVFWFMRGVLPLLFGLILICTGLLRKKNGG
ncbi:MAG: hypothetical protein K8R88_07795 [Armatimonadetes bacterium]|nr:hypothetical protein [Armatimonadota bacterium]